VPDWSLKEGRHALTRLTDIFRKDANGNPVWIDAVQDLDGARQRLSQLALARPGEYFVFDHSTHSVVTSISGQIELDSIT
jgi:hypothetical protein